MNDEVMEYRVTPSIASGERRYRIEGDALVVESVKQGDVRPSPLTGVTQVRLTCIKGVGRCELHFREGRKLVILSRSFRGIGDFLDQKAEYNQFVLGLHARLAVVAPGATYIGGTSFGFALGVLAVICGVVAAVIMAMATEVGNWGGAARMLAPVLGTLAFGVPMMMAGRAKGYRPEEVPGDEMP